MKQRTIISPGNGQEIPVTKDLNVKPLMLMGKPVYNGNNKQIMDDQWIYVYWPNFGNKAMNVNRAQFCQKHYISETTILQSIGNAKITNNLNTFIDKISNRLIFKKDGITYRIFLKKTKKGFDINYVKPYWLITHSPNIHIDKIPNRYKKIVYKLSSASFCWAHNLIVDLQKTFNFLCDEN